MILFGFRLREGLRTVTVMTMTYPTLFAEYLATNRISFVVAAQAIGAARQSIWRYAHGVQVPIVPIALAIERWTQGAVPVTSWDTVYHYVPTAAFRSEFAQLHERLDGHDLWLGRCNDEGHPMIKQEVASRVAWQLGSGRRLRPDECIMHACGNRLCVRFDHLALASKSEVTLSRRTPPRGRALDPVQVRAIREICRRPRGERPTDRALAAQYGVGRSTISLIRSGRLHRET